MKIKILYDDKKYFTHSARVCFVQPPLVTVVTAHSGREIIARNASREQSSARPWLVHRGHVIWEPASYWLAGHLQDGDLAEITLTAGKQSPSRGLLIFSISRPPWHRVTLRDCVTLTRDPEQIERFDVRYLEMGGEEAATTTWSWSIVNLGNGVKL